VGIIVAFAAALTFLIFHRSEESGLERIQRTGSIRIGYAVEAPYAFAGQDGSVTGESIEIARYVASRLQVPQVLWVQVEFGSLIAELNARRIDVIAAGMFITPERARQVAFSEPTFHVAQSLLVAHGNPLKLHAYEDFAARPQIKVAVLQGAIERDMLIEAGAAPEQILEVPDARNGVIAVASGLVAGLALSEVTVATLATANGMRRLEAARPFRQPFLAGSASHGYGAFAFRRTDRDLLDAWNRELKDFVGSDRHRRLLERFGLSANMLPGDMSTARILGRGKE
jgi:polar amino acid transport system substrate-binding protein